MAQKTVPKIFVTGLALVVYLLIHVHTIRDLQNPEKFDAALKMGGSFGGSSMATYVFSRSKPAGERDGIVFTNESPATFISKLRERRGKNIWLMGGGELARDFLTADLVDCGRVGLRMTTGAGYSPPER